MTKENPTNSNELPELTFIETIERLAAVNYSYKEMAIYIGHNVRSFREEANKEDSEIWLAIQRGRLQAQFDIDDKLAQNARTGNITAAQMYKKSAEEKRVEDLKAQIFYGD